MASEVECDKGGMWILDQKLDQSMDEEAGKLRNVLSTEKVSTFIPTTHKDRKIYKIG